MTNEPADQFMVDKKTARRRIVREGIEPALLPAGFVRGPGTRRWHRQTPELQHAIALFFARGAHRAQWGVCCPQVAGVVYVDVPSEPKAEYGILSGRPGNLQPSVSDRFALPEQMPPADLEALIAGVHADMKMLERHLGSFQTRRQVRDYLLAAPERSSDRSFHWPGSHPLMLLTVAALALVDSDPDGRELARQAEAASERFDDALNEARRRNLRLLVN